jgi:hypothetical protein
MSGIDVEPKSRRKPLRLVLTLGLILLAVAYVSISLIIGAGVRSVSATALRAFPGDRISALMALVDSEQHTMSDRNRAIWALGQLGDSRALPFLESRFSGRQSDEGRELSQYELKKAIVLCGGATNITAFVWRRGTLAK